MKLIIDIPEKIYDAVKNKSVCGYMHYKNIWKYGNLRFNVGQAIKDGTPLDEIIAEIEALPKTFPFINHIDTYVKEDDVKKIIDKYIAEGRR